MASAARLDGAHHTSPGAEHRCRWGQPLLAVGPPRHGVAAVTVQDMVLRIVFADDNYLVREGVSALLAEVDEIDLVDTAADPHSLIKAVAEHKPDAVLTDIRMPPTHTNEGIEAAKRIRAEFPDTGVVVLSQFVEEEYAFELLSDGVAGLGYLLKERVSDLEELVRALHEVSRGGSALDPRVVEGLLARKSSEERSPLLGLTEREREVLQEMAGGRNNATIAKTLFMSDRAVEKHISSVFQKLGLVDERENNRRVMAVLAYLEAVGPAR
jgi:DNA-binding NarL/FixJ family response regulator